MVKVFFPTSGDYIQHHLVHLELNLHTFKLGDGGFWTLVFCLLVFFGAWHVKQRQDSRLNCKMQPK